MITRDFIRSRRLPTGAAVLFTMSAITTPAAAQTEDGSAAATQIQEVVVTGSRIRRSSVETDQPTQFVSSEAMVARGYANVADALNDLPQVGIPESPRGDQGTNAGRNYLNLLGLGSQRTLTLVNSRRFVTSNPSTALTKNPGNQVDLNSIPAGLIDHVEVIQATGAATYGSDAIGGVANILLKDNIEGVMFDAQRGISSRGDADTYAVQATGGMIFADGRGNIAVSYERSETSPLLNSERPSSAAQYIFASNPANTGRNDGIPAAILIRNHRVAELTAGGLPFVNDGFLLSDLLTMPDPANPGRRVAAQFGSNGELTPYDPGTSYGIAVASGGDGFNTATNTSLVSEVQRDVFFGLGHYDLTPQLRLSSEVSLSRVIGKEPANQSNAYNTGLAGNAIAVGLDNPFLSAATRAVMQDQGLSTLYLNRALVDIAPDNNALMSEGITQRVVLALDGEISRGERDFYWNVSGNYGHSGGEVERTGIYEQRFQYAVDAVSGPNGPMCRVTRDNPGSSDPSIAECSPLNLFGVGNASDAAKRFATTRFVQEYDNYQTSFQANLGGSLLQLPAGWLAFASGYEHRKERSTFGVNEANLDGVGRDDPILPGSGKYHTSEVYGELLVPVFGGDFTLPLVERLDLNFAGRATDNSIAGSDTAWNVGAQWTVIDDVMLRGSLSRTFRAPSLVELFLPRTTSDTTAIDPCDARSISSGSNPAARLRNCQALFRSLGLPENHNLTSTIQNISRPYTVGGNPDLRNEVADSVTAGIVLRPRLTPGLTLTADWVKVEIEDAITSFNTTAILSNCYDADAPDASICNLIARDANAQITMATTGYVNASTTRYEGFSYSLNQQLSLGEAPFFGGLADPGRLEIGLDPVNLRRLETSISGLGHDINVARGEINAPEWKGQASVRYVNQGFTLSWFANYVSSAVFDVTFTREDQDILEVGDYFRHDVSLQYRPTDALSLRVIVNNVFDREPPHPNAIGFLAQNGSYDVIGRNFVIGANLRF